MALDPITAGLDLANSIVGKIWPDKSAQEQQQLAAALALIQGQMEINKTEAANPSVFVSGWRPFIGWYVAPGARGTGSACRSRSSRSRSPAIRSAYRPLISPK